MLSKQNASYSSQQRKIYTLIVDVGGGGGGGGGSFGSCSAYRARGNYLSRGNIFPEVKRNCESRLVMTY